MRFFRIAALRASLFLTLGVDAPTIGPPNAVSRAAATGSPCGRASVATGGCAATAGAALRAGAGAGCVARTAATVAGALFNTIVAWGGRMRSRTDSSSIAAALPPSTTSVNPQMVMAHLAFVAGIASGIAIVPADPTREKLSDDGNKELIQHASSSLPEQPACAPAAHVAKFFNGTPVQAISMPLAAGKDIDTMLLRKLNNKITIGILPRERVQRV